MANDPSHAAHLAPHHEESDVDIRGIFIFAAGLVVLTIVIGFLMAGLFAYFNAREAATSGTPEFPLAVAQEHRTPPEPRLQTNPREDLRELRAAEQETLTTYGWVDRNAGIVRIPIDEAIKLTLARGLPSRQVGK
jgi:hypothetical protein